MSMMRMSACQVSALSACHSLLRQTERRGKSCWPASSKWSDKQIIRSLSLSRLSVRTPHCMLSLTTVPCELCCFCIVLLSAVNVLRAHNATECTLGITYWECMQFLVAVLWISCSCLNDFLFRPVKMQLQ